MKNLFYFIIGVILISCTPQKETVYATCDLGNLYEISVPSNLVNSNYKSVPGLDIWMNESDRLFLSVYFEPDSVKEKKETMIREKKADYNSRGFYTTEENITDSTITIKFSKGMLLGKCHIIVKQVEFGHYIVVLDGLSSCSYEEAEKIASSIKLRIKKGEVAENQTSNTNKPKYAIYKNNLFSVGYPLDWSYLERPDEISDVYIGSNTEKLGFTIMHFDNVEMTLKEVVDMSNNDLRTNGLSVIENTKMKLAGYDAYKTVFIGKLLGVEIKNISYSFITEQGTFYNIKFGNDAELIDKNSLLISRILNSFKLKNKSKPQIPNVSKSIALDKTFGNQYFSLNYPSDWEIVNEDANTTKDINISIQVMQKRVNDTDFLPNVNIIKSPQKYIQSTEELVRVSLNQIKQVAPQVRESGAKDVVIDGCSGTCVTYNCNLQGYELEWYQYIVKKADNTTYTITCTIDYFKRDAQKPIIDAIVKSLVIK